MKNRLYNLFVLTVLIVAGSASAALAQSPFQNSFTADEAREARQQGRVLGASEIMRIVQQRYPELRTADARLVSGNRQSARYLVKMLSNDGRVVEVNVDAKNGKILGTRGN